MRLGLSLKVVAVILPLVFAPLAVLAGLSFYQLKQSERVRTEEVLRVAMRNLAADIRSEIGASQRNLKFFADANDVRKYAGTKDEAKRYNLLQPGFIDYLKGIRRAYPAYEELRLILLDGYEDTRVAPTDLPNLTEDESGGSLFRALKGMAGESYAEVAIHPDAHELRLLQAQRVYALDTSTGLAVTPADLVGYLVMSRDLQFVQKTVEELNRNISGELLVVDAAGRVLATRDRSRLGKPLSGDALQGLHRAQGSPDPFTAEILPNLFVMAEMPRSVFSNSAVALARALLTTAGLAVIFTSFLLSVLLARLVVRPVKTLTVATVEIGHERPAGELPTGREDEIGALARALELMRKTLLERRQGLLEQNRLLAERGAQLEFARDAAQAANRAKSAFLATMSHEIRTPMNGVLGMTELLLGTSLQARQRSYATTILQSGQNLLSIINDILDFSKIEEGKLSLHIAPFSPGELCEELVDALGATAFGRSIELICDLEPALFTPVEGDQARLRQVLINLVGNAIKFTDRGEVILRGRAVRDQFPSVRFEIIDTGIGIPADVLLHIFEPFYQVDGTASRRHGGTGLGLAIVRQLLDAMGGKISLQSEEGAGTRVTVELPFDCPPLPLPAPRGLALVGCESSGQSAAVQALLEARGYEVQRIAVEEDLQARRAAVAVTPALIVVEKRFLQAMRREFGAEPAGPRAIVLKRRLDAGDDRNTWSNHPRNVLELPLRRREVEYLLGGLETASAAFADEASAPERRTRVLVADGDMINQLVLVEMLSILGLHCTTAGTGEDLLKRLEQSLLGDTPTGFGWILLDGQLADMDPHRVVGLIKAMEQRHGLAVGAALIGLGSAARAQQRAHCLAAGMDDFLERPCSQVELESLLARWRPAARGEGNADQG